MDLHRLKMIMEQELKSIITTLCAQDPKKKEKIVCMGIFQGQT